MRDATGRAVGRLVVVLAAVLGTGPALADDPPAAPHAATPIRANDREASDALAKFDAEFPKAGLDAQRRAVKGLAAVLHSRTTERLHRVLADGEVQADVRGAALEALRPRGKDDKEVVSRLGRWLAVESEAAGRAWAKGELGVPVDRRSGVADPRATDVRGAIERGKGTARVLANGLRAAADLSFRPRDAADFLRPFLHSPYDELAVAALDTAAAWTEGDALPDVIRLFRMYPKENRWETGAVAHINGSNASAQGEWNRWFGHPLKQRARPDVFHAILRATEALTGERRESPDALAAWMDGKASKRKKTAPR